MPEIFAVVAVPLLIIAILGVAFFYILKSRNKRSIHGVTDGQGRITNRSVHLGFSVLLFLIGVFGLAMGFKSGSNSDSGTIKLVLFSSLILISAINGFGEMRKMKND